MANQNNPTPSVKNTEESNVTRTDTSGYVNTGVNTSNASSAGSLISQIVSEIERRDGAQRAAQDAAKNDPVTKENEAFKKEDAGRRKEAFGDLQKATPVPQILNNVKGVDGMPLTPGAVSNQLSLSPIFADLNEAIGINEKPYVDAFGKFKYYMEFKRETMEVINPKTFLPIIIYKDDGTEAGHLESISAVELNRLRKFYEFREARGKQVTELVTR